MKNFTDGQLVVVRCPEELPRDDPRWRAVTGIVCGDSPGDGYVTVLVDGYAASNRFPVDQVSHRRALDARPEDLNASTWGKGFVTLFWELDEHIRQQRARRGGNDFRTLDDLPLTPQQFRCVVEWLAWQLQHLLREASGSDHCAKTYDPMMLRSGESVADSYAFDLDDGGRHHPFKTLQGLVEAMVRDIARFIQEQVLAAGCDLEAHAMRSVTGRQFLYQCVKCKSIWTDRSLDFLRRFEHMRLNPNSPLLEPLEYVEPTTCPLPACGDAALRCLAADITETEVGK